MKDIVLELKGLKKSFDKVNVLKGIDLTVERGEFITLLGASGCGKTTTLRLIAGLETPDGGSVLLEGEDITELAPNERDVNTIFQNYALFPYMNVEKNVGYGLKVKKLPKDEIKKRVEEALQMVQLSGFEKRMPHQLSGGQRQRVAIARAVVNEPKVLLLDEPLGALDLKLRRSMQTELKKLQKKLGITFIYITHDQEEAINLSDRIAVMRNGVFEQIGTPNEIYYRPKTSYVADFVGDANLFKKDGKTYAIRSENILLDEDSQMQFEAVVEEKNFIGGQLKILFTLSDGQKIIAGRRGMDYELAVGESCVIGWDSDSMIEVEDCDNEEA